MCFELRCSFNSFNCLKTSIVQKEGVRENYAEGECIQKYRTLRQNNLEYKDMKIWIKISLRRKMDFIMRD